MRAYAAELKTASAVAPTLLWVSILQDVNIVLGTIASLIGITVGAVTLYRMWKAGKDASIS